MLEHRAAPLHSHAVRLDVAVGMRHDMAAVGVARVPAVSADYAQQVSPCCCRCCPTYSRLLGAQRQSFGTPTPRPPRSSALCQDSANNRAAASEGTLISSRCNDGPCCRTALFCIRLGQPAINLLGQFLFAGFIPAASMRGLSASRHFCSLLAAVCLMHQHDGCVQRWLAKC